MSYTIGKPRISDFHLAGVHVRAFVYMVATSLGYIWAQNLDSQCTPQTRGVTNSMKPEKHLSFTNEISINTQAIKSEHVFLQGVHK